MIEHCRSAFVVLAVAMAAFGCAPQAGPAGEGAMKVDGTLSVDGSSTVFPISQAIAEEFSEKAPEVKVSVGTSGTGGGFEKFCNGETDVSDASRPIKKEEHHACARERIRYLELRVALDGLSIVVNPRNTWAQCLSVEELKNIWRPGSRFENWRQLRANFPRRPIKLYGAGTDSGTFDYFTSEIVGESGASRTDYVASEDDNVLVQGLAGDQNGLGYLGYGYYIQNKQKLRTVAVDGGGECVEPTGETITSGAYKPLSRPLFIYVSERSARRAEVEAFIDFYLSEVDRLVADVGYLPLPGSEYQKEVEKWDAFKTGDMKSKKTVKVLPEMPLP